MQQGYRRMADAIEHTGLDCGIMQHILKDNILAYLQFMVKLPHSHKIARQTTVSSDTINMRKGCVGIHGQGMSSTYFRLVRHLETVGHMAGKADIDNGCTDAPILNHIYHL